MEKTTWIKLTPHDLWCTHHECVAELSTGDMLANFSKAYWYSCSNCGFEGFKEAMIAPELHKGLYSGEDPGACWDFLESERLAKDLSAKGIRHHRFWNGLDSVTL